MIINQYLNEIKYRINHTIIISIINLLIIYYYSPIFIDFFIIEIYHIKNITTEIITINLTNIIYCKFLLTLYFWFLTLILQIYIDYFLFMVNALYKKQYIKYIINILKFITITQFLLIYILKYFMGIINTTLIDITNPYNILKIQTLINLKEYINLYLLIFLIFLLIYCIIYFFNYKINRKIYYTIIIIIITTLTPPDINLHIQLIVPFYLIYELIFILNIFKQNWKRLDSNQRSKIQ